MILWHLLKRLKGDLFQHFLLDSLCLSMLPIDSVSHSFSQSVILDKGKRKYNNLRRFGNRCEKRKWFTICDRKCLLLSRSYCLPMSIRHYIFIQLLFFFFEKKTFQNWFLSFQQAIGGGVCVWEREREIYLTFNVHTSVPSSIYQCLLIKTFKTDSFLYLHTTCLYNISLNDIGSIHWTKNERNTNVNE